MEHKQCKKCGQFKPISEFSKKNATGRKPGYQPRCKPCSAQDTKNWYSVNKNKAKDTRLKANYGIGLNEYNARLLAQDYMCPICNKQLKEGSFGPDSPVVDHCHTSGDVRGIICNECNRGLGYFRDNPIALYNAAIYLENHYAVSKEWCPPV